MFFKRYDSSRPARSSYLIADEITRAAAVVDPQPNTSPYQRDAVDRGFQIRYVFLTRAQPELLIGSRELQEQAGASVYLGECDSAGSKFTTVQDGDVIQVGDMRLCVVQTQQRSPGGISLLIYDLADSDREPFAMLTGDTALFKERNFV